MKIRRSRRAAAIPSGLRFPSLDLTEEADIDKDARKFVRSVTKVVYKGYKFFTVETETDFTK
jgi:hypothetical protein